MNLTTSILLVITIIVLIPLLILKYYQAKKKEVHIEFPITFKYNFIINFDGEKTVRIGITNNN